jgi:hypothetical protein
VESARHGFVRSGRWPTSRFRTTLVTAALVAGAFGLASCSDDGPPAVDSADSTEATAATEPDSSGPADSVQPSTTETTVSSSATSSTTSVLLSSSVDTAADQAAAQAALLDLEDFEPGWTESPDSNDQDAATQRAIAKCAGVDAPGVIDFGGALARTGDFTGPDGYIVDEVVSLAPSADEATARLDGVASAEFIPCVEAIYVAFLNDQFAAQGVTVEKVELARLNVTQRGDQTVAYRVTVNVSRGTASQLVYVDIVALRSGRGVAGLNFRTQDAPVSTTDFEQYVALAEEKLARAI